MAKKSEPTIEELRVQVGRWVTINACGSGENIDNPTHREVCLVCQKAWRRNHRVHPALHEAAEITALILCAVVVLLTVWSWTACP